MAGLPGHRASQAQPEHHPEAEGDPEAVGEKVHHIVPSETVTECDLGRFDADGEQAGENEA